MAEAAEQMPEEVSITMLPPEAILGLRVPLTEHIERAMAEDANSFEGVEDVFTQAVRGHSQIWLIHESNEILGVVTTTIIKYPRFKVLRMIYLAGRDANRWLEETFRHLAAVARERGCDALEGYGCRRGWLRQQHVKAVGLVPVGTLYRKLLKG